ncbi:MAG: recombination protein RecR [Armatimonadetes bacterium]|nr:recombination protein RecR [Armatimonadota bacterium]
MLQYARPLQRLLNAFERLPGIGPKNAQRLAFHLLRVEEGEVQELAAALSEVRAAIRPCRRCFNYSEGDLCPICADPRRDPAAICAVEEASDVMAIERSGEYHGLYHVLGGRLSPLSGVGHDELNLDSLLARVREGGVRELILATSPTVEGDATALEIARLVEAMVESGEVTTAPRVTRIALGLPVGGDLDYADGLTLARALRGRTPVGET